MCDWENSYANPKIKRQYLTTGETHGRLSDSERSDKCIDFTMMCVYFWSNIWSSKNASIFDFSPSLKRKLNLVDTLGSQNSNLYEIYQNCENLQCRDRVTRIRYYKKSYFVLTYTAIKLIYLPTSEISFSDFDYSMLYKMNYRVIEFSLEINTGKRENTVTHSMLLNTPFISYILHYYYYYFNHYKTPSIFTYYLYVPNLYRY
ncbi:hypothetical protein AGLY_003871 [Aphis glycines]|uniref:Uncharacterized protein n=1 Tax=Aphis glycines TaxID=307491 RepID=A0A6G0U1S5_APHGL|nr:hypothetical protein AGLY_003871 [Aphis glycines]